MNDNSLVTCNSHTTKLHPFKVHNSVNFSRFTELRNSPPKSRRCSARPAESPAHALSPCPPCPPRAPQPPRGFDSHLPAADISRELDQEADSVWLLSPGTRSSRFIHVSARVRVSFLFTAESHPTARTYHSSFIHSQADGHVGLWIPLLRASVHERRRERAFSVSWVSA